MLPVVVMMLPVVVIFSGLLIELLKSSTGGFNHIRVYLLEGVTPRLLIDTLSELYSQCLKWSSFCADNKHEFLRR